MHVVFGATGRAGGQAAHSLIERGEPVRVVVRRPEQGKSWQALGAEVAVASLDDAQAVGAALTNATAAFLLNPPPVAGDPFEQAARTGSVLAEAVQRSGLPKAVVLSSIGAQHASGTGVIATLHQFEATLTGAAPTIAFLRSGYFIETWSEVAAPAITQGILPTFLKPDQKIPMVSTIDVGQTAARLMCEDWKGTRIVELGGPDDWSAGDVAMAFTKILNRPVETVFIPPDQQRDALITAGLPAEVAAVPHGMYEGIANGRVVHEDDTEHRRGTTSLVAAVERIIASARSAA